MTTEKNKKATSLTPREKQFSPLAEEAEPDKVRLIMQQAAYKALGETKRRIKR